MKIVITSADPNLDSPIDPRFGRAAYLIIVDTDTNEWQSFPNPGLNSSGGAGIKVAQFISTHGVKAAISGEFGPNAYDALQAADITMHLFGDCTTVKQTLEQFNQGGLQQTGGPTGEGRHGK